MLIEGVAEERHHRSRRPKQNFRGHMTIGDAGSRYYIIRNVSRGYL